MPVKIKRKLRGADGGIHPHLKNSQDFPNQFNPPKLAAHINMERALFLLQSNPVVEFFGEHPTLQQMRKEAALLLELAKN